MFCKRATARLLPSPEACCCNCGSATACVMMMELLLCLDVGALLRGVRPRGRVIRVGKGRAGRPVEQACITVKGPLIWLSHMMASS